MTAPALATLPNSITSRLERRRLFRWLLVRGINFHPDTPASEYVDRTGCPMFDPATAEQIDRLMGEALSLDAFAYSEGCVLLRQWIQPRAA